MNKPRIVFTKNAQKDTHQLNRQVAKRIGKKLNTWLASGQPLETASRLTKPADAQYRWRVGDYRVLFDYDSESNLVIVLKIQHRRQIYR